MKKTVFIILLIATVVTSCKNTEKEEVIDVNSLYSNAWVKEIELKHNQPIR